MRTVWTPKRVEEAERLYRTNTAKEIADHFGVSHTQIRQVFHLNGIQDPKASWKDRRAMVCKLWNRGSVDEIARYVGRPKSYVRRVARRVGLVHENGQLTLFSTAA